VSDHEGILPVGWSHNYEIYSRLGGDGLQGLGADSALDASAAIAATYTIADLFNTTTPSFDNRLTAVFVGNWLMKQLASNAVFVTRGSRSDTFIRLPESGATGYTYNPPPGATDTLVRSGSETTNRFAFQGLPYEYPGDLRLALRDKDGSVMTFSIVFGDAYTNQSGGFNSNILRPSDWAFPDGVRIDFTYQTVHLGEWPTGGNQLAGSPIYKSLLTKVKNNLGRELNFIYPDVTRPYDQAAGVYFTVRDENSRQVQFEAPGPVNPGAGGGYVNIIGVDGQITRAGRIAQHAPGLPDPLIRGSHRLDAQIRDRAVSNPDCDLADAAFFSFGRLDPYPIEALAPIAYGVERRREACQTTVVAATGVLRGQLTDQTRSLRGRRVDCDTRRDGRRTELHCHQSVRRRQARSWKQIGWFECRHLVEEDQMLAPGNRVERIHEV